jgi:polyhydroxyalkanoate synthase subunit PhaC
MADQPPQGSVPPTFLVVDWLDAAEKQFADAFEDALADDAMLDGMANVWRTSLANAAAIPPGIRELVAVPSARRGSGVGAGLGDDYPIGLFDALRASWATAAQALAFQQGLVPGASAEAAALQELAIALGTAEMPELAPTPTTVVESNHWYRLRLVSATAQHGGDPILIVSSFINRWYVLDLLDGNSFLAMLAGLGRPVYLLEWATTSDTNAEAGLADLCAGPLRQAIDGARAMHAAKRVHLIGYSMGGTLAAILAARYPEVIGGLATVASPVHFAKGGMLTRWLSAQRLDVDLVAGLYPRVPSALVHMPFWWLRPSIKTRKLVQLARGFRQPGYLRYFYAAELWNYDHTDVPRGVFRSWVRDLYQRDDLIARRFVVEGEAVDLRQIACPLLVISGAIDAIVPPESAEALGDQVTSPYRRTLRVSNGHHVRVLTAPGALAAEAGEFAAWLEAGTLSRDR